MRKYIWLGGWGCGLGAGLYIGHPQAWPFSVALVSIGFFWTLLGAAWPRGGEATRG